MRFNEFVVEKVMDFRTFSDVGRRLGTTAKIGFEFEMIVPAGSQLHGGDTEDKRETQVISFYDSLDEFDEVFQMSRVTRNRIDRDYERWVESARTEHEKDRWQDHKDPDEPDQHYAERIARGNAYDSFDPDQKHTFKDWIKSEFGSSFQFVHHYDLEPQYGWYDESERHASVYTEPKIEANAFMPTANEVEYVLQEPSN